MTGIVAHTYPEWWLKLAGQVAHWSTDYSKNFGPDEERFHFHIFVSNISMYTARRLNFTRADRWREQEQFQNAVNMAVECCPVQFNRVEIICERMYGQC